MKVSIGFPCGPSVPWQTSNALAATAYVCGVIGIQLDVVTIAGSSVVRTARNAVVTKYLDTSKGDLLFWIDSDMVWKPEDFVKFVRLSEKYPVLCAAYPMKTAAMPVLVNRIEGATLNDDKLLEIESTGLGFTCLRKEVLERLIVGRGKRTESVINPPIYQVFDDSKAGEDVQLFRDMRTVGYPAMLDPSIKLGHVGTHVYERDITTALGLST